MSRIENMGFHVKSRKNFLQRYRVYIKGENERGWFNGMVNDPAVKWFSLEEGRVTDLLPSDWLCRRQKAARKYMWVTATDFILLNSFTMRTGLMTYYRSDITSCHDLRHYDYRQFAAHSDENALNSRNSKWHILNWRLQVEKAYEEDIFFINYMRFLRTVLFQLHMKSISCF